MWLWLEFRACPAPGKFATLGFCNAKCAPEAPNTALVQLSRTANASALEAAVVEQLDAARREAHAADAKNWPGSSLFGGRV